MNKRPGGEGRVQVTLELDPAVQADQAFVVGEFNDWSLQATPMQPSDGGGFATVIELDAGRAYRFRYFLGDDRWENDWAADRYVPNEFGAEDSVIDLTDAGTPHPAKKAAGTKKAANGAKKAPAKKAAAKKAAEPVKKAAKKATKKQA
jgi:hypothetical protein